jgi:hypothetical protein
MDNYVHVLTGLEDGKVKVSGLGGVNLDSAAALFHRLSTRD